MTLEIVDLISGDEFGDEQWNKTYGGSGDDRGSSIIETSDGARLTAQVVDCKPEDVSVGQEVKLVTRLIQHEGHSGILQYGYKAVLK